MQKRLAIIGGGPNLAMQTARRFGREGWEVFLGARDEGRLATQKTDLTDAGVGAHALPVDATDSKQVQDFVATIEDRHGPIDVLNYNAAVIRHAGIMEQPAEAVVSDLMTDVGGAFFALQAVLPRMRDRKAGTVILSGGGLAVDPWPGLLTLSVGKAGLRALALALGKDPELADIHIVHAVLAAAITPEAGSQIADLYWGLANEPRDSWQSDVTFGM